MPDWNVVVGVKDGAFRAAQSAMEPFGPVERSGIVSVLTMKVADPESFLEEIAVLLEKTPDILKAITGIVPLQHTFEFEGEEDFAEKVGKIVNEEWGSIIREKKIQFRTRRRGYASEVPRKLDPGEKETDVVDELGMWGLAKEDCEYIITIETLRQRAGMSLWSSRDFDRYSFLDMG